MGMATTESQFHVLAVDDSLLDRKLIERLLKTSSYQGTYFIYFFSFIVWQERNFNRKIELIFFYGSLSIFFLCCFMGFALFLKCVLFFMAVTTVDSGSKALEFLGFHEDDQTNPDTPPISSNSHQVL